MDLNDVAAILHAKPCADGYHARCPVHRDKHPSLWFGIREGKLYFECKTGCDYMDVRRAVLTLLGGGKIDLKNAPEHVDDPIAIAARRGKIRRAWDQSFPILPGGPAWKYLVHTRRVLGADEPVPECLHESPAVAYWNDDDPPQLVDKFPAMIARLDAPDGAIATLHRTYLTGDGRKASASDPRVTKVKKLMVSPCRGATDGAAIRLHSPMTADDMLGPGRVVLGIAEGIETALACKQLFAVPTWAAWSASGLGKVVVPPEVTDLIIFIDHDVTGLKYAGDLIRRLAAERPAVDVRMVKPDVFGEDFADQLMRSRA